MAKISAIWSKIVYLPRLPLLFFIRSYQKTLSPDHGALRHCFRNGYCRFYPSCSEYGYQVIKKRGLVLGLPRLVWRIIRCNPWNKGGVDLP